MRALILASLLLASCSTLVDGEPRGDCVGSEEQCDQTTGVREWFASNVDGYYDDGMDTKWVASISGFTFRPLSVVVTNDRVLCHEYLHAHLWRETGNPCSEHDDACGWDEEIENACKRAL